MNDTVDGTAEEVRPDETPEQASVAVVRRERRHEVIRPLAVDDLVQSMLDYQELLPRLLDSSDYQDAGRGKRFVKKSGWRKIATAFDLDVQMIRSTVERDEHGQPTRAEVWARAIAPTGRAMDGDGYCSVDEERFSGSRGNKSKLENDLRATATTRAMNRAISGLVGMGDVSAEEVDGGGQQQGPPHGAPASTAMAEAASTALAIICAGDLEAARTRWGLIKAELGYMPHAAAAALITAAAAPPADEPIDPPELS